MFCLPFPPWPQSERNELWFSLCFCCFLSRTSIFNNKPKMFWYWLKLPIGVKERLVDDDGVGELCTLCLTGHNNGPLLDTSYPKSKINRNKWCLKTLIYTRPDRLSMFSALVFSLGFRVLSSEGKPCISFLKVPMTWKYFLLIWKAFQNTEEWRFSLWNIFFRFRHIDVFLLCKLDKWWRHIVCN